MRIQSVCKWSGGTFFGEQWKLAGFHSSTNADVHNNDLNLCEYRRKLLCSMPLSISFLKCTYNAFPCYSVISKIFIWSCLWLCSPWTWDPLGLSVIVDKTTMPKTGCNHEANNTFLYNECYYVIVATISIIVAIVIITLPTRGSYDFGFYWQRSRVRLQRSETKLTSSFMAHRTLSR